MEWMILPLKRYADFEGRSRRTEYWMFTLLLVMAVGVLLIAGIALAAVQDNDELSPAMIAVIGFGILGYLAILIPSIAVTVRRLHDQNLSGWFYLLGFIPYIGGLILFVFMVIPGTRGDNRFGPDPKGYDDQDLERVFG